MFVPLTRTETSYHGSFIVSNTINCAITRASQQDPTDICNALSRTLILGTCHMSTTRRLSGFTPQTQPVGPGGAGGGDPELHPPFKRVFLQGAPCEGLEKENRSTTEAAGPIPLGHDFAVHLLASECAFHAAYVYSLC